MWVSVQCAVQGTSHIKNNIPCQDKTFFKNENGTYAVSLADGAGSCKLSHIGAEVVTHAICDLFCSDFDAIFSNDNGPKVKADLMDLLINKLTETGKANNCDIKDLSSTLLFVAVKDDNFILGHIGDGVVGYLKNNEMKIASMPDNGEFSNTTIFTTSQNALASLKLFKGKVAAIDGFVLMSDGPEAVFYDKVKKTLASSLKKLFSFSKALPVSVMEKKMSELFNSIVKKHTNDDCSMIIFSNMTKNNVFNALPFNDLCDILNLSASTPKKVADKYTMIIDTLQCHNMTCKELSKIVHVKHRYLEKKLTKLCELGYIVNNNNTYGIPT
ncbi:PP2C family serine/threonine-protein phosphatase [Succinimonas amylolytica]|uniref:PP2C family serine/threonine-protein phosphatase n=1 Tax=Succinimonas amylolytica TaxID=83769 RepID=UPI0023A82517